MKNKIIASLMAAALFVGMAVPAFAYGKEDSTLLADTTSVAKIVPKKATHTIKNGGDIKTLEQVYVLASNSQLADDSNISIELEDNKDLAFAVESDGTIRAIEDKGSATVVVKSLDNEKVTASFKVVAAKADKEIAAAGFRFEETQYKIGVGVDAKDVVINLLPVPAGSKFIALQDADIENVLRTDDMFFVNVSTTGLLPTSTAVTNADKDKIVITLKAADLVAITVNTPVNKNGLGAASPSTDKAYQTLKFASVSFPVATTAGFKPANATTRVMTVPYKLADVIGARGTITLNVGDTCKLGDNVKQGPSAKTHDDGVTYAAEYYNDSSDTYDYIAFTEAAKIIGVRTGKVKIVATLDADATKTATFIVNVVDNNAKTEAEAADGDVTLVNSTASTTVGATGFKMALKNLAADATVTYSSLNDAVAKVSLDGVVTGVAAGTTQIVADVDGVKLYCTVTVNAGTAEKPGPGVPQTGIVTLVALF